LRLKFIFNSCYVKNAKFFVKDIYIIINIPKKFIKKKLNKYI